VAEGKGLRAIYLKALGGRQGCKGIVGIEADRIYGLFSELICAIHYLLIIHKMQQIS
jgi:hypothetical protein